ncbi:MAG TPA: DUF4270 family protein [Cyclobacteriaceae bacterium]|nr:DUF4270 family protein [Cyclobacteriaceae bacterium]
MNLWVKRAGQLLVAALFLMSCEDDTYLLGFQNKNKKFNVRYQEFSLPSTVVLVDSIVTDNLDGSSRLLVGQYQDLRFGNVRSELYTQFFPAVRATLDADAIYDSVTIKVRLDFYSYGKLGESEERFTIHEITEDSLTYTKRYYYNSIVGYDPTPIGEATSLVNTDSLSKHAALGTNADTLLFQGKLSDDFGLKLLNRAKVEVDSTFSRQEFSYLMKGLVFAPSQSNMIIGLNTNSNSEITLHYHTDEEDSLKRIYRIGFTTSGSVGFNNITTTRTGDLAAISQPYEGYAPASGLRYLQNGSPVITKLDISEFYRFITGSSDGITDSITHMEINAAEISMNIEPPQDGLPPPADLYLRVMNSDDLYLNNARNTDSTFMDGFYAYTGYVPSLNRVFGSYYYPGNDVSTEWIKLSYDSKTNKYVGFATLFFQNLFLKKESDRKMGVTNPNQIHYLGLVPFNPVMGKSVNRAVINSNSIKLKVTYTTPKTTNQ